MTIEEVNKIFKTKYPDGKVYQKDGSRVGVIFDKNSKVYDYLYRSYADLLCRLGFNVQYAWDIENCKSLITQYKEEIEKGYTENIFFKTELTEEEIEWRKKRIEHLKEIISTAIVFSH